METLPTIKRTVTTLETINTGKHVWRIQYVAITEDGIPMPNSEPVGLYRDDQFIDAFQDARDAREHVSTTLDTDEIRHAFREAKKAVQAVPRTDGGGTCNMDTPQLKIPARKKRRWEAAASAEGIELFTMGRGRWVFVTGLGVGSQQGTKQTREAVAACEALRACGVHSDVHYAVD